MKRSFRNRDYVKTVEDLLFTVVGDIHPVERVLAYLKYIPDNEGRWGFGERRYRRALRYYTTMHLGETFSYLERTYPQYLYDSAVQHLHISAVPAAYIQRHYCPEAKLSNLLKAGHLDSLERKAIDLARLISEESRVDMRHLGVTGSILVGIHNPRFSDIDLTVYGRGNSLNVKAALTNLLDKGFRYLHRFDDSAIDEWLNSRSWLYPLSRDEVELVCRRHWNRGVYQETAFSIHPGRVEKEVDESYGDRLYHPRGIVEVEAVIEDASDSMFMPGVYSVSSVQSLDGSRVSDVREIVTYEGLYCDIASRGERVRARGKLEAVEDRRTGEAYHRILIGSMEARGTDYLKPKLSLVRRV